MSSMTTELMPAWNNALTKGLSIEPSKSEALATHTVTASEAKKLLKRKSWKPQEAIAILAYYDQQVAGISDTRLAIKERESEAVSRIGTQLKSLKDKASGVIMLTIPVAFAGFASTAAFLDNPLFYVGIVPYFLLGMAIDFSDSDRAQATRKFLMGKTKVETLMQEIEAEKALAMLKDSELEKKQIKFSRKILPVIEALNQSLSSGQFIIDESRRIQFQKNSPIPLTMWEEAIQDVISTRKSFIVENGSEKKGLTHD